MFLLIHTNNSC